MSETSTPRLKVSREGMVLIKSFEGFRPRAVREEDGRWVIGYGHSASAREGLTVAEADAELLLQYDLMPVVKALNEQVREPLNQHQFDALASFAVSIGVDTFLTSDVLQRVNEGHAGQAADALIGWPEETSADARLRRRAAERALFVADPASDVTLAQLLAAPLPSQPVESLAEPEPETGVETLPVDARAAAVASLLGETYATPVLPVFGSPALQPASAEKRVNLDRYSPYAAAIIGPLPGFAPAEPVEAPAATAAEVQVAPEPIATEPEATSDSEPATEAVAADIEPVVPVTPLESAALVASPFPAMDQELVLTPATEADFVEPERAAWPSDERPAAPVVQETALFEDEPTLSVLRHEVEPAGPRRFNWSVTGAYLFMGAVGLVAFGASAASFRKAMTEDSYIGDFTIIGWVLALIGVVCVGLSSWKLYVGSGKSD